MVQPPTQDDTEKTRRQDRLREEIVAFASDAKKDGYSNFEVCKALFWCALHVVRHEPVREHYYFMMFMRDSAQGAMDIVMRQSNVEIDIEPCRSLNSSEETPRIDRLRGELVAFVSDCNDNGYNNLEVGRALIWSAYQVAEQEPVPVHYYFVTLVRDNAQEGMNIVEDMIQASLNVQEKMKVN
ncbi:hypothetical protein [Caballeronia grimmiae]|uniref:hypothetical protein n=1 Tax=Caballeronia grimmiae TaxID=1071679 RepID=UPI0038BDC978